MRNGRGNNKETKYTRDCYRQLAKLAKLVFAVLIEMEDTDSQSPSLWCRVFEKQLMLVVFVQGTPYIISPSKFATKMQLKKVLVVEGHLIFSIDREFPL